MKMAVSLHPARWVARLADERLRRWVVLLAVGWVTRSLAADLNVTIDPNRAGPVISPLWFGQNLETTRRGVWTGLSAEKVANRKFAAVETGLPRHWTVAGGGRVVVETNRLLAYTGVTSVRLDPAAAGERVGIAQSSPELAFTAGQRYRLRAWVRTEAAGAFTARITGPAFGRATWSHRWSLAPGAWKELTAVVSAPHTGASNRLELSGRSAGPIWIGAVSLQPTSAWHGMRRDVVGLLKEIRPGTLRFPGGCYAEFYRWRDGLLPVDQRPPLGPTGLSFLLPATDDFDTHEIGTDEFMALCEAVGAEPAITLRVSETTAADAAAWVEYCNGPADSPEGRVRARRGHPQPFGVGCWFIGNELYAFGRGGINEAGRCATATREFATAVRRVDAGARLTACTQFGEGDWNVRVLGEAGGLIDLASAHDYLLDHFKGDLAAIARAPQTELRPRLEAVRTRLDRESPPGRRLRLAFDEWNTHWGERGSVAMGVYAAGVIHLLGREGARWGLDRAYFFMPINEGAIKVTPLTAGLDAAGEVFALERVHQGNRLLPLPDLADDGDLDALGSVSADGRTIYITAVNRSVTATQDLRLGRLGGVPPKTVAVRELIPLGLEAASPGFRRGERRIAPDADGSVLVSIPPCAVFRVRLGPAQHGE